MTINRQTGGIFVFDDAKRNRTFCLIEIEVQRKGEKNKKKQEKHRRDAINDANRCCKDQASVNSRTAMLAEPENVFASACIQTKLVTVFAGRMTRVQCVEILTTFRIVVVPKDDLASNRSLSRVRVELSEVSFDTFYHGCQIPSNTG